MAARAIAMVFCLSHVVISSKASAQASGSAGLPRQSTGRLQSPFTAVTSVRELANGMVLATDPRDNRVVVGDFASGSVTELSRVGRGPHEFPRAYPLYQLRDDTSVMVSLDLQWGMYFVGTTPGDALRPDDPLFQYHSEVLAGFDRSGEALVMSFPKGRHVASDSGVVLLLRRKTVRADTILRVRGTDVFGPDMVPQLWALAESARIAPDGAVAIVRVNPFRVDWWYPDGHSTHGLPIAGGQVPFDAAERRTYAKSLDGVVSQERIDDALRRAPATIAPYIVSMTKLFTPEGFLLVVRVNNAAHQGNWYQVVNRNGKVVRDLLLPSSSEIRGFGAHSVYVTVADSNGLQTLTRYPWH